MEHHGADGLFLGGVTLFVRQSTVQARMNTTVKLAFNKYMLSSKIPYGDQLKKRTYIEILIVHYTKSITQLHD